MLAEVTKKQRELDALREVFQGLRTFVLELRRATKGKQFDVVNSFAWESALSSNRMLVIDLASWVDSLLPPRPLKKGVEGWLREHVKGSALLRVSAKKERADAYAANEIVYSPAEDQQFFRAHLAELFHRGHQAAMLRLFGKRASRRGHPNDNDVLRLEARLFRWAQNLRRWRNTHAHRYGAKTASVRALRFPDLVKRFDACSRLMNDFRLLVDGSTYVMSRLEPSKNEATARDLVDIIVAGTIPFAVEQWNNEQGPSLWQKRDAYYARLHRRRRRKKTDPFNRAT